MGGPFQVRAIKKTEDHPPKHKHDTSISLMSRWIGFKEMKIQFRRKNVSEE